MSSNVFGTANCTDAPASVPSNAGVSGAGFILSFVITAMLALGMSASLIFQEFRSCRKKDGGIEGAACRLPPSKPHTIRRKLLNSYSDQQILQGIGLQAVGLAKANSLVPYHFFMIWMLSLLSMATHNATLLALVQDFKRDWLLRWLRQFLMFVNLALSSVYGVFVLRGIQHNIQPTLPIACVWVDAAPTNPPPSDVALNYIGTIIVLAGNPIVFGLATWYLHSRAQRFYRITQFLGVILMILIAIGAAVRVMLLSQAFGSPSVALSDKGERDWSFGQLLSLLLLFLPVITIIEIYRGDIKVAPPIEDKGKVIEEDAAELVDRGSPQAKSDKGSRRSRK